MERKDRRKLQFFVNSLSEGEARRQLFLAYCQMERCLELLNGEDVEPVTMKDNGLSSDLELFYTIKKKMLEAEAAERERDGRIEEYALQAREDRLYRDACRGRSSITLEIPLIVVEE